MEVSDWGLGIMATTCPTCGTIKVYVDGELFWDPISLRSAKTRHRRLVLWSDNGEEGFGLDDGPVTVTIKVASSGRPVIVDGILLGPGPDD
jgi:hypothetical protein